MRGEADQKLTEFITILRDADFDASWESVLDALWLASLGRNLDLGGASSAINSRDDAVGDGPGFRSGPSFGSPKADDRKNRERDRHQKQRTDEQTESDDGALPHAGLYAHGDVASGDRTVTASPILLPAARTLPDRLAVARALKPFRQRRPSDVGVELDEARTAELTAELRLVLGEGLFVVLRPQQERWYEAHVVLEDEPAVEVWGAPLREFADLLRQTGAFRLVRVWRLRLDHAKPRDLQKARLETPAGALISPRVLAGDERRLVFFASHGDSLHWVDGIYATLLKSWSAASLVLLHLLPRHRWTYTLLGEPQALARASRPGSAAEALDMDIFWWRVSPDPLQPRVLRLPVVPIVPQALGVWSRMQMGLGQGSEAFLIDPAEALTDAEVAELLPERIEPARALTNLRERSVAAFDLAVMLASAPFTLPVARLVQEVTQEGQTDFSVLAELMLSGVVVPRKTQEADERTSETTYFEINGAVRPHLLRSLRKADAITLAVALDQRLSAHLSAIAGRNVQFSALLADARGETKLPSWARAFAHLTIALHGRREPPPDWSLEEALEALEELSRPLLGQLARLAVTGAPLIADSVRPDLRPFVKDPRFVAATPIGLKFRPEIAAYLADRLKERAFLGLRLLWVDDYPDGNASPAAMLEQGGAEPIQYALTTEKALQHPALRQFDVILSDMTRNDNHAAGYELLSELQAIGLTTPVIIFAASAMNTATGREGAVAAGAFGGTNRIDTLLQLIEQAARSATLLQRVEEKRRSHEMEAKHLAEQERDKDIGDVTALSAKHDNPQEAKEAGSTAADEYESEYVSSSKVRERYEKPSNEGDARAGVFNLTIEDWGENYCRIVANFYSSSRQTEVEKLKPSFRQRLRLLQEAILQSAAARDSRVERMVQEIGSELFDFIFQRKILDLYQECFQAARRQDAPFLIRLRVTDPTLAYVPWETMYDKKNRFYLAASQSTQITRAVGDYAEELRVSATRPIRMLGMAARFKVLNGFPLDQIEVDAEQVAIKKALSELNDGKGLKLSWIPSGKARDLNRRFLRGDDGKRWDLFHFIGHGGHDPDRQMGFVVVQEEDGSRGVRLYADALSTFLTQPGQTPCLVVLNSCSGAQSEPGSFSSTAAELIERGVPAVIAMQFEISDAMGLAFAESFYTYLADNVSIQAALTHTRAELKARQFAEWFSPVLYMRGLDGNIFVDRAGSV